MKTIIEKLGIKPIESFCIGIGDGTNNFVCLTPEVRELEQQRNEMLEALIKMTLSVESSKLCKRPEYAKVGDGYNIIEKADPQHRSWEEIRELIK